MKITAARLSPYHLPLRAEWASAAGGFTQRDGWLLRLSTDNGYTGYGDCAPLPETGGESLAAAERALNEQTKRLEGQRVDAALKSLANPAGCKTPAARCAVESALLDLLAQAAGQPLCTYLGGNAARSDVAVNAALGSLQRVSDQTIIASCAAGFRIIKLKVGLDAVDAEIARLHHVAALLPPATQLRLDANRAWREADAARFLQACAGSPIEMIEEPLADPETEALQRLQAICAFPIGLDESITELLTDCTANALLAAPPVRRLVLKPPRLGGLLPALALARRAGAAGLQCIVTSSIDSTCGVLAAAHLAAAIDNGLAHGLATSCWLAEDTGAAPFISGGRLTLPARSGLGFAPAARFD